MTAIDVRSWAKRNLWPLSSGETATRPGLRRVYTPDSGKLLVGGFSVLNQYTGELWHYVFDVASTGTKALRLQILDEDFAAWQTLSLRVDMVPRAISAAVVEGQILIGSPDMPTLWGLVGSSVRLAVKVDSRNPSTTAIDVPRGIVSVWNNRAVIANGNSLYVSDAVAATGGDLRTFVAESQNQRPGAVFGIHEGAGGMLVAVTTQGVYGLSSDYSAMGTVGSVGTGWQILNHAQASSYSSSCVVRGRVYALTQNGWAPVDTESDAEQSLTEPVQPRAFGTRISLEDYRAARMIAGEYGPMVAIDDLNALHMHDVTTSGFASWWTSAHSPTDFKVRGTLRDVDGSQMLMAENGIFRVAGNFDGELALSSAVATQPVGSMMGTMLTGPSQNALVRHVHVGAEIGGAGLIYAAVRGKKHSATPAADPDGLTIGATSWGSTLRYTSTPVAAARLDFGPSDANATRDVGIEVAADGCLTRLGDVVEVDLARSAARRPQKVG